MSFFLSMVIMNAILYRYYDVVITAFVIMIYCIIITNVIITFI